MSYTQAQRKQVCDRLIDTVSHQVKMYSQRQLSIKGRVTIMNSLILAKVWYLLRILVVPQAFFQKLRRLICEFVGGKKTPRLSYLQMCQPIVDTTHSRSRSIRFLPVNDPSTPLVPFPGRPRSLLRRLYKEIMNRSVDLQPWIWDLIGKRFDPLPPCSFAPSLTTWWSHPFWSGPVSLNYRLYQTSGSLPPHRHPYKMIKAFWTAPMLPNGRTIWYKVLSNTIPLQHILAKMHPQDPTCIHCHLHEDLAHFVYHCPAKRPIWEAVLAIYVPLYFLTPTCILDFLLYLRNPPARLPLKRTLTLLCHPKHHLVPLLAIQDPWGTFSGPQDHQGYCQPSPLLPSRLM